MLRQSIEEVAETGLSRLVEDDAFWVALKAVYNKKNLIAKNASAI